MVSTLRQPIEKIAPKDFKRKFAAWWNGEEYVPLPEDEDGGPNGLDDTDSTDLALAIAVAQGLWGEGYLGPGTPEYSASLVKDMALTAEQSLAILGIGLAGPARDIVRETDVWISGYESHAKAIDEANRQCAASGLTEKINISVYDPSSVQFSQDKYHALLAFEEFTFVEGKDYLLNQIFAALKPGAAFHLVDYVAEKDGARPDEVEACLTSVWGRPYLWTVNEYRQSIHDAGFSIQSDRSLSGDYIPMIERGWTRWRKVLASLQEGRAGSEHRSRVMRLIGEEATRWADRLDALNSGALGVHLIEAQKPNESA